MANPWDNDPVVGDKKADANPWDSDPIVKASVKSVKDLPQTSRFEDFGQANVDTLKKLNQLGLNVGAGMIRGAGSIGATLMWPIDKATDVIMGDRGPTLSGLVTGKQPESRNDERRRQMDQSLRQEFGVETDSYGYKGGKLAGEIAGTAGAGGALANGVLRAAPLLARAGVSAPAVADAAAALSSGGFRVGGATGLKGLAMRGLGGAATGAVSSGMVDPKNTGMGAIVGGALPGVVKAGGELGSMAASGMSAGARRLMQSALKPTIAQRKSGDAAAAVEVMLQNGINPSVGGVGKLRDLIDVLNDQVKDKIANSGASVSKQKVVGALSDVEKQFGNQVSPTADLAAIRGTADDFINHPNFVGDAIPVQAAQAMKQGTYKVLSKKFGQMGSADTEAQKALARGLKEQIADAVPGIAGLNAQESQMIRALDVVERRALMDLNKNPVGLAALAHSPTAWAAMMADKSALFKSLSARMLESSAKAAKNNGARIEGIASLPMLRSTALAAPSRRDE